ncbi:MAG: DUF4175 domain-containing protein [Rhodobacteraceae bacterium]|nr:DUF4175 domain-containing protein [Paracoccaceae bacterium]
MADFTGQNAHPALRRLRLPLALTRLGMGAERLWHRFWPLLSVVLLSLAVLILGLHDVLAGELMWGGAVLSLLLVVVMLVRGVVGFRWPTRAEAMARLDATLPGRPIQALVDTQAAGFDDPASVALWRVHQARMAERAVAARAVRPDLRLAARDPYAVRYASALIFGVALIFGSVLRVGSVAEMTPGGVLDSGPSWEGWVEPPRYTGHPTLYLNDIPGPDLRVPAGSTLTLRFYGEVGALTLVETVSGQSGGVPPAAGGPHQFTAVQPGVLRIDGSGGRIWHLDLIADAAPRISVEQAPTLGLAGQMGMPFSASDDYGVVAGEAMITLNLAAVDRRHGLAVVPEQRDSIIMPVPLPITGDRSAFKETLIEDFSKHPWANLPVTIRLTVLDDLGQEGRFFDPMAATIAEQRRDLLWSRDNARRIAQVLRAVSHRPEDVFPSATAYLRLRVILSRLETYSKHAITDEQQNELAEALWVLAIQLEEGDWANVQERLRRAQERLDAAMRNGASEQEIAELMQELREATDAYIRQLGRQAQEFAKQDDARNFSRDQNSLRMSQNDLQRMMDRIQELMQQGRMAEAQQALQELQALMEKMRVTRGQNGLSPGEQAMEGLAETLREQQGLSDQAFRDLQEQFNPNAQQGQSQENQGWHGGQGRGRSHEPDQQGQGREQVLADRQQALRGELWRQQHGLPGAGTPEGQAAGDALDRAGRAMDSAEEALRTDDFAGALDHQSEAMDALRDGMRLLGEQMARNQQSQPGQESRTGNQQAEHRDPLGRNTGSNGFIETYENLLDRVDSHERAIRLLEEIRRRSTETGRTQKELDYLKRLLDRF